MARRAFCGMSCAQGNELTRLRGCGLKQLALLRTLNLTHNLISDPWELTPLAALPALTCLAISPQRVPGDPLTCAGPPSRPGETYRRLVVLLTLHSEGSQHQAGLNFLDRSPSPSQLQPHHLHLRLRVAAAGHL